MMCLSIAVNHPDHVLSKDEHEGFEFITVRNGMGFRCGYIRVPDGHPWHGKNYEDVEPYPDVHGGLTFAEADKPCDKVGDDDAWWLGFDCAHYMDRPDPCLPCYRPALDTVGSVRTQDYVECECRSLCEQAKVAASVSA